MNGAELLAILTASLPDLRGRLTAEAPLSNYTWFRVGGPAEVLYVPADEADLVYFMKGLPDGTPITMVGLGSNLLVRDGGIEGVVIRLGRGFGEIKIEEGSRLRTGTAVPDTKLARAAADAGIAGLSFYRGIPGCVGGALRMNGGAHGSETCELLVEARAVDRQGNVHVLPVGDFHYAYRYCGAPADFIFTEALLQGVPGDPAKILAEMDDIAAYREEVQPIKSRTGGSTFKNPPGKKSWQLIDAAGCRGLKIGDAKVSELHCNFLINEGEATAADIETLGETVRARVKEKSGVELEWEIKRLGIPA
ncbi:MAG: UDP-N-acetylmuramate dehydrogenase [Hyphomicrobiaceae bacterium]|nr:UDP-N-acetylmuramate dehydrogenase [Hyphomicrobiaceae bacterium]MDX2450760.1 UDP-N-acetylmuramate dehydrogenase [Hyphomicrobiaceae bacterium]